MCGLCGTLGEDSHWITGIEDPEQAHYARRHARAYRARLINAVLAPRRLSVTDFQSTSFVLGSATGKQEIVQDLGGIWRQAEAMSGHALDPLSAQFLDELEHYHGKRDNDG
ncbi:hypothetical protein [Halomonas binhaiensis]|uniref:Uncharacterized protein n=1 Tax=Halomonas binhaiensis TaxID=2562282 RepID=A0A5C1ND89_9GAMM|nr:hypothetical protein [Halomonas binhaiensis]QEM81266.1 hypothetical protein E4T21_06760 [Halomonas binhaiensis]